MSQDPERTRRARGEDPPPRDPPETLEDAEQRIRRLAANTGWGLDAYREHAGQGRFRVQLSIPAPPEVNPAVLVVKAATEDAAWGSMLNAVYAMADAMEPMGR